MKLTIFYDSQCPLCMLEMQELVKFDTQKQIRLVDLHSSEFRQDYTFIDASKAMKVLHGQLANGEMIYGLDVSCTAWAITGKYRWLKILRWPVIKFFADLGYRFFARYRSTIALILTGKKQCTACSISNKQHEER